MLDRLRQSQNDYLELLKRVRGDLDLENVAYHLDKIRNFWFRKQKLLEMCSQYLFNNSNTYFYTAVSRFNVDNSDKNILFALGNYQIFDDPILSYLEVMEKGNTVHQLERYFKKLKEKIVESIDDLIVLLEKEIPNFYVLPLRFSSSLINKEKVDIRPFIENFFIEGIDFNNLQTYENIDAVVVHEYLSQILLFDYDDPTQAIKDRLKQYRIEYSDIVPQDMNDTELFRFIIYGYFSQAMDIFLFPSLFEGLPVSLVEAQATGIKCVISDGVPEEAILIPENVEVISLKKSAKEWADKILQIQNFDRKDVSEMIKEKGYDIKENAKKLEEKYRELLTLSKL